MVGNTELLFYHFHLFQLHEFRLARSRANAKISRKR